MAHITVKSEDTLILRQEVCSLTIDGEERWECSLANFHTPVMRCAETGKWVIIPWDFLAVIAEEALRAGPDEALESQNAG